MSTEELSENERILNAINDTILNRATSDQSAYMIGTRRLDRIPIPELLQMQAKYTTAVRLEKGTAFGTVRVK